jgi:hypothetical protein
MIVSCAVVLGAPCPAGSTLFVSAYADFLDAEGGFVFSTPCPHGATSCSKAAGSSSASAAASYGSVDGSASTSAGPGARGRANAEAFFTDELTFLNGTGTPTHLVVEFLTTGAGVSGATGSGDFAELQVFMSLEDTVDPHNTTSAEYILDIEGGTFTTFGLPDDVLSLDLPDGHGAILSLQIFLDAEARDGDVASVSDPSNVFVTASNPYSAASGTVYPTSPGSPVPEPGSLLLLSAGLAGLGVSWGRKARKRI